MKRLIAILAAAAMLAVVVFGCARAIIDEPEETTQPAEVAADVQQALADFLYEHLGEDIASTEFLLYDLDGDNAPEVLVRQERGGFTYDVFRHNPTSFSLVGELSRPLAFYRDSDDQVLRRNGGQFERIAFAGGSMTLEPQDNVDAAQLTRIEPMTALRQSVSTAVVQRLVDGGYIDEAETTTVETTTATNADGTPVTTQPGQTTAAATTQAGATTTAQPGTTQPG
ncbi:MAG: hypothetical protein FWB76_07685, partial [Oscillospiraceae bacterium]|nr:hypothetical protein [Oscillospiraceae bacterium]